MAKKHIVTSDPLFQVDNYSSGISNWIGDIDQSLVKDPYWDELLSESNQRTALELDRLIPVNTKIGVFIVEQSDICLHLGIISNTNESGFFVDWLNFGESSEDINFLCGTNCFNNWERDQEAISKLAIAPESLIDKFLDANPNFSLKNEDRGFQVGNKIIIPDHWEDKGGLWDTYPQYWVYSNNTYHYDGEIIYCNSTDNQEIINSKIKKAYLNPRWYVHCAKVEAENQQELSVARANKNKPHKFKQGGVYLHSSGKKIKAYKFYKTTGLAEVLFLGEIEKQKVAIANLSFLPVPQAKDFTDFSDFEKAYQEWLNNCDDEDFDDSQQLSSKDIWEQEKGEQFLGENLQVSDIYDGLGLRIFSKKEQRSGEVCSVGKTGFSIDWDGWIKCAYSFSEINKLQLLREIKSCLPCSTVTPEQVQPPLPVTNLELEQPSLSKSTAAPNECLVIDSQKSLFTQISEPIKDNSNGITSTGYHSPAREQVTPASEKDSTTQSQKCSFIPSERSQLNSLNLLLLSNPEELLTTDLEQFLGDSEWSNTVTKIQKSFQRRSLAHPTNESEFLLLPTPTTYPKGSGNCRPAGTNRLEQKLRPFINQGDKLHPMVSGWMMGFPIGWVEYPLADTGEILSVQLPLIPARDTTSKIDGTALISTAEQLHPNKQKLSLNESVTLQNSQELEVLATTTNTDNQTTTTKIKALTLHQPWASLVGKYKHYETRGKATNYRGKIAIHAAVKQEDTYYWLGAFADLSPDFLGENVPFGSIVAIADLTDCIKMTEEFISQQSETELRCGLWEVGRYAWKLENVVILNEPIPARGMPGLWDIELSLLSPVTCHLSPKPEFKPGEYILNGRVGEIIEASPGEYFSVKYGNSYADLKCYFWGQDDDLIEQLAIAPQELVEKFLREKSEASQEEIKTKKSKIASGSLAPFLENKKLKDGTIVTYPRVTGERDKLNYDHWRWGYYYEVKVNGEWRNKSMPIPARIAPLVREMIDKKYPVEEIKSFILQNKTKKHKPD
ncbi:hypothetical protein MMC39_29245 [Anabaena sp. CCAP 1446/1C]|uniref:Uncharacterized protein n=1 Tax=Anabaena cylindrica (strain ATCC 27899 / PCC 7122) TaxID=272123 RepID=K9ZR91_ANACC|nr:MULTISPECIES: hypothetical protein [Anabaena]AFZ61284.1 hypothetical protein Anacy_6006 [Anabaena cylindrica PCC 7122]MCM2410075.1 hypothetical protein [Anabaena sp. CCAP 1446/1C]BAY06815.1 hypothetical protein NIES19_60980 [Anabaena cylindrica PCC 7122]